MNLAILTLLVVSPTYVISKCGQTIETNTNVYNYILLFPLIKSKTNHSYNMEMVVKEIAYRHD